MFFSAVLFLRLLHQLARNAVATLLVVIPSMDCIIPLPSWGWQVWISHTWLAPPWDLRPWSAHFCASWTRPRAMPLTRAVMHKLQFSRGIGTREMLRANTLPSITRAKVSLLPSSWIACHYYGSWCLIQTVVLPLIFSLKVSYIYPHERNKHSLFPSHPVFNIILVGTTA